ncbi:MAG: hypothetical protein AABZ30_09690 [Myxococcota bacterium]
MSNLLVYIDVVEGRATDASLGALDYARRAASERGATLYGLLACPALPDYGGGDDDVVAVLSRHGADKLIVATDPSLATMGPETAARRERALALACERYRPVVVVLTAEAPSALAVAAAAATRGRVLEQEADRPLPDETPIVVRLLRAIPGPVISSDEAEVLLLRPA